VDFAYGKKNMRLNSVKLPSQCGILVIIFVLSMASPGFGASVQAQVSPSDSTAIYGTTAPCFAGGNGYHDASASCVVDQEWAGTFSASASAHADYGHLSGTAWVATAGITDRYQTNTGKAYSEDVYTNFSDHLFVPGSGLATATIHFSTNVGTFRLCASGFDTACDNFGDTVDIRFLTGDGAGAGFDLTGALWARPEIILEAGSSQHVGPVEAHLDITGIDITGAGVTGPITSQSGALYTADGVTSAPEPVLWPATALFLFVGHRSRSK
jgi:hypothetical protein